MTKYYTDGWLKGSRNPSPYGGGYTVVDENNNLIVREDIKSSNFTNNEAEIRGILFALEYAEKKDIISTDSMCCLTWVNTGTSKARPDLNHLLFRCKELKFSKFINLMWEGRDFNLAGIYNEKVQKENTKKRIVDQLEVDYKYALDKEE